MIIRFSPNEYKTLRRLVKASGKSMTAFLCDGIVSLVGVKAAGPFVFGRIRSLKKQRKCNPAHRAALMAYWAKIRSNNRKRLEDRK